MQEMLASCEKKKRYFSIVFGEAYWGVWPTESMQTESRPILLTEICLLSFCNQKTQPSWR